VTDYFILYETTKTNKTIFGFTKDSKIALSELNRLYQIDPFQLNRKFSIEMTPHKPMIGFELKVKK
jgi:hypothetical protein